MDKYIIRFDGTEHAFLSNFCVSEISIEAFPLDKIETEPKNYVTTEHAFQAAKTHDTKQREEIRLASHPSDAKRLGRKATLRDDWEIVKDDIMLFCLRKKFEIKELKEKLLATGDAVLVEGTRWHDNYWGVCYCEKCKGVGKNMLGKLLMQVRNEIKGEQNDRT